MGYLSNKDAVEYINSLEEFVASNTMGVWLYNNYFVFSYGKIIGFNDRSKWYVNDGFYSQTTSRHRNAFFKNMSEDKKVHLDMEAFSSLLKERGIK